MYKSGLIFCSLLLLVQLAREAKRGGWATGCGIYIYIHIYHMYPELGITGAVLGWKREHQGSEQGVARAQEGRSRRPRCSRRVIPRDYAPRGGELRDSHFSEINTFLFHASDFRNTNFPFSTMNNS